jgi:SagB-type dehydrogenase family enzyme
MELRRSRTLILHWRDSDLVVENYLAPKSSDVDEDNAWVVDQLAVALLSRFDDWQEAEDVADSFESYEPASVREAIKLLVDAGLLVDRTQATVEDRFRDAWRYWSEEARFFHFGTKDAVYIGDDEVHRREAAAVALASGPPPPIFKRYPDAPRVRLGRAFLPLRREYGDVLVERRTHRSFTPAPVDLRTLSTVLHYTFAPMQFLDAREYGTLMLRTSPGGGARHELEAYIGVLNVEGLTPGLYHYLPDDHSLELLSADFGREQVDRLAFGQRMTTTAGFVVFLTAVFERAMYKYRHPRTLRMVLLDAGHLAQTFVLTCTALGLGPFQTAAFRDSEVEHALGIDGFDEGVLYLLGAGNPVRTATGLPVDIRLAGHPVAPTDVPG